MSNATPCLKMVVVAEYSNLSDTTRSGDYINEGLLNEGITPCIVGSRAADVFVLAQRASEARTIVRKLIEKHHLDATVIDEDNEALP